MSEKTVITKIKEMGEESGIRMFFPQNRVLYADQFTYYAPDTQDERAVFCPSTIDDVFEHYRPILEGITLTDEDGELSNEDLKFGGIRDFDDDRLIAQSTTLSNSIYKKETYYSIIRFLERNRSLRQIMLDTEKKKALTEALKSIKAELETTK